MPAAEGGRWADILTAWSFDPLAVAIMVTAAGLYVVSTRTVGMTGSPWPRSRTLAFLGGLGVLGVALISPLHVAAEELFSAHMVQHLLISMVAAPLLVLGSPVNLALRSGGRRVRRASRRVAISRAARFLTHPIVAWTLFAVMLVGSHFSPLYQAALEGAWIHRLEHGLYLGTGLLFWLPVVGLDPPGRRLSHPMRLLYVILAGPVNTITALAIYGAGSPLYPAYLRSAAAWGTTALADQQTAAALMWVFGDLAFVVALAAVLAAWVRHDRRAAERLDRALETGAAVRG